MTIEQQEIIEEYAFDFYETTKCGNVWKNQDRWLEMLEKLRKIVPYPNAILPKDSIVKTEFCTISFNGKDFYVNNEGPFIVIILQ